MIACEQHGDGTQMVLVHGVGMDRRTWRRCLPALEGYRILLPDLRGHGASPAIEGAVTLGELAGDVAALLDEPAHVVGFSLGGLVAMRLALAEPALVRSLTLVSAVASRSPAERQAVRDRLAVATERFEDAADAAVDRWFSPAWRAREPELADEVRATLLANDRRSYLSAYRLFAEADAELRPQLGRIAAPTVAVTGSEDGGSTPAMTRALAAAIPGATAAVVDGARHLLPLERPDALTDLILEHLRRTDADRDRPEALPALHRR